MIYQVEYRCYDRPFRYPLRTHHGIWSVRSGILLRLTDPQGHSSYGEIAPLSWFGSETLEDAVEFCQSLQGTISTEAIHSIPDHYPACQFGFSSAWDVLMRSPSEVWDPSPLRFSGLLPSGAEALSVWPDLWDQGYRTFKWKIGIDPIATELDRFKALITNLPEQAQIRLDANGGLSHLEAGIWLQTCDHVLAESSSSQVDPKIEYLEQPLGTDQLQSMIQLADRYRTPIALDESVANLRQAYQCYHQGWCGIFVIKPAIMGSVAQLRQFLQDTQAELVLSSVFETAVGRDHAFKLAHELNVTTRALGFGTEHLFPDPNLNPTDFDQNPLIQDYPTDSTN